MSRPSSFVKEPCTNIERNGRGGRFLTDWRRARFRVRSRHARRPDPHDPIDPPRRPQAPAPSRFAPASNRHCARRNLDGGLADHPGRVSNRAHFGLRSACDRDSPGSGVCVRRPRPSRRSVVDAQSAGLGSQVPYQSAASDLRDFYILAGTASATLVGLLFVGLSLHLRVVIAAPEVRSLARVTLANFGAVLFVTLFMVIAEPQVAAGLQLIGAGAVSLVVTAPSLLAAARKQDQGFNMRRRDRARLILRFGLSGVSYLALMGAGILLLATLISASGLVLVVAIVTLLLISLRNTWDLLVTVGEVSLGSDKDEG